MIMCKVESIRSECGLVFICDTCIKSNIIRRKCNVSDKIGLKFNYYEKLFGVIINST